MTFTTEFRREDGMWTRIPVAAGTISEGFFPVKGDFIMEPDGTHWEVSRRVFEYGRGNYVNVIFYCRETGNGL